MKEIYVLKKDEGQRIDKFLLKYYPLLGKNLLYKALRKKDVKLNRKRAQGSDIIREGDKLSLFISDEKLFRNELESPKKSDEKPLKLSELCSIVYEDENIILADKRKAVLSQSDSRGGKSLNEALLSYCGGQDREGFSPSICNRIDRNTTGLVSFAKNYASARELFKIFNERSGEKYYLAAVLGEVRGSHRERAFLMKDKKRNLALISLKEKEGYAPIETGFETIAHGELMGRKLSLLRVELITGRPHQIRAHLSYLGYPVLGDEKYGDHSFNRELKGAFGIGSQMLHAYEFIFPREGLSYLSYLSGRSFKTEVPKEFKQLFSVDNL